MTLEEWLDKPAAALERIWLRARLPILITLVANLLALVIALTVRLTTSVVYEPDRLMISVESLEKEAERMAIEEKETKVDEWNALSPSSQVRNAIVDANELNSALRDEKRIDADQLYRDAEEARARLQQSLNRPEPTGQELDIPNTEKTEYKPDTKRYTGPSVVSYSLPGRKAYRMPVPAYKCVEGGTVIVVIRVTPAGGVSKAIVDEEHSASAPCLWEAAINAAQRSRFSPSKEKADQMGTITYLFVAQ